jgi:bacillithiol system protein YtxJ
MAADLLRLTSPDQIDTLLEESESRPVLLFKHSVSCGTSAYALDELRDVLDRPQADDVRYAVVVVQSDRETSNAVATRLGVRHETPQALLLRGGRVVWNASHHRLTADVIARAVATHGHAKPTTTSQP